MFEELENNIGYTFKNKNLILEAMTHPSMSYKNGAKKFNYERLEFLGDSILSMVINDYLFNTHREETEGDLSKRKAFLVSKGTLSNISRNFNLGKFVIMTKGEENSGGRENVSNIENIMESLIGAIYLDSDFYTVKDFILNIWSKIDDKDTKLPKNPKSELQELIQKYYKVNPEYKLVKTTNNQTFIISLTVPNLKTIELEGNNIKKVERILATKMLDIIKKSISVE